MLIADHFFTAISRKFVGKSINVHATILKGSLGHDKYSSISIQKKPTMPRCYKEDPRFRAIWMKEFLGYSIGLVPTTLYMSPKTIHHYVLKCINTEEVKACRKFCKTKK